MAVTENKAERVAVRTRLDVKALLRQAVVSLRKMATELLGKVGILKAETDVAEDSLADRRIFRLDEQEWQAFQDTLNGPVEDNPRLDRLLAEKSVLE